MACLGREKATVLETGDAAGGIPVAEQRRVPIHEDVPEVLDDGGEVDPEHTVILQLRGGQVVLDGPAPARENDEPGRADRGGPREHIV